MLASMFSNLLETAAPRDVVLVFNAHAQLEAIVIANRVSRLEPRATPRPWLLWRHAQILLTENFLAGSTTWTVRLFGAAIDLQQCIPLHPFRNSRSRMSLFYASPDGMPPEDFNGRSTSSMICVKSQISAYEESTDGLSGQEFTKKMKVACGSVAGNALACCRWRRNVATLSATPCATRESGAEMRRR
jgi:hypothetical protein